MGEQKSKNERKRELLQERKNIEQYNQNFADKINKIRSSLKTMEDRDNLLKKYGHLDENGKPNSGIISEMRELLIRQAEEKKEWHKEIGRMAAPYTFMPGEKEMNSLENMYKSPS